MSGVERRKRSQYRTTTGSKRRAIYVDYAQDTSKRSGVYGDTTGPRVSDNMMNYHDDERTPLLRDRERLERGIISEVNRVDAEAKRLARESEALQEATTKYFGEDQKIHIKKRSIWKRICCCCAE